MKKLILTLLIFLVSSLPVKADDPLVLDPIIDHLRLAMKMIRNCNILLSVEFYGKL